MSEITLLEKRIAFLEVEVDKNLKSKKEEEMKSLRYLLIPFVVLLLLLGVTSAKAAESTYWHDEEIGGGLHKLTITWTAAAGGTTTAVELTGQWYETTKTPNYGPNMDGTSGYVLMAIVNPGATAPADNYEILLTDKYSVNIFGTALDALDTANTEDWEPDIAYRTFEWPITFDQESGGGANNANCNGEIHVYWMEAR